MGRLLAERFPLNRDASASAGATPQPAPQTPTIDFRKEMHDLRVQVDALLGQGKVQDAETLMEDRRKFLAENGYFIRKINQAYFAFNGLYADTPASVSPIGTKMAELRKDSPSLGISCGRFRGLPASGGWTAFWREARGRRLLHLDLSTAERFAPLLLLETAEGRFHEVAQGQQELLLSCHQVVPRLAGDEVDDGAAEAEHQLLAGPVLVLERPASVGLGHSLCGSFKPIIAHTAQRRHCYMSNVMNVGEGLQTLAQSRRGLKTPTYGITHGERARSAPTPPAGTAGR